MNETKKHEIMEAVGKWRPRLRLMDWSIAYRWDAQIDDDSAMECETQQKYRRIQLKVSSETKDNYWQTVEKQVLHELCHCLTAEGIDLAEDMVSKVGPGRLAYEVAQVVLEKANERLVEWIARTVWEAYEPTKWDEELVK